MSLPRTAHTSMPWRIHELAPDFEVEDVWALPTPAGPDDFPQLVRQVAADNGAEQTFGSRLLFAIRWKLGALLGWDKAGAGIGERVHSLRDRLPADLREGPRGPDISGVPVPFTSVYLTDNEWVCEIANRTVHGLMHLGWVPDGTGGYRGQMAVLVKPHGLLGRLYLTAIKPFRHLVVYPSLLRAIGRNWQAQPGKPNAG